MNKTRTKMSNSVFNKIVAVVTALSLVFLQVPVTGWHSQAMADATDAAQEQLAANSAVDIPLTFENAYITYAGQPIAPPATKVTIPGGAGMEFTATADSGYQVESVKATINGTEVTLAADGNGVYKLTAADVAMTSNITVRGVTAPTVEEVTVAEPSDEAAGEQPAADEADAADAVDAEGAQDAAAVSEAATAEASAEELENTNPDFTYSDDDVTVTAKLSQANAVPANAVFQVKPITADSEGYNYDVYMAALNENAAGVEYNAENTLLYDIAFMVPKSDDAGNVVEGEFVEFEPTAGTVTISIAFKKNQLADALDAEKASDLEITHLPLRESVLETVDSTENATNIYVSDVMVESVEGAAANVAAEQIAFTTDSLSAYSVSNATSYSAASTELGAQAVATSGTSYNLADFLTSAKISAPQDADGKYIVTEGSSYEFTLAFGENRSLQFPDDGGIMSYKLPDGLDIADGQRGTLNMKVNDGGTFVTVAGNEYWIENNTLYFRFNASDPNFSALTAASNAKFSVTFSGTVNGSPSEITFKDGISKDLAIDTSNSVSPSKLAWFDKASNKMRYTVAVTSKGLSKNVNVKDTLRGTGLTLDAGSIKVTSSTGNAVSMTGGASGNSFDYTIAQMKDGEVVTFTYTASVDPSKIPNQNGSYVTTGKNKVAVKSDGDPTPHEVERSTTIDYTPTIQKSSGAVSDEAGGKKTLSWTITANPDAKVSMAGTKITDTISDQSKSVMKYAGSGISVDVYDASGKKVETRTVAWSQLTSKSDSSWTYTVPDADKGNAYKYVITYQTEADVSSRTGTVDLGNGVTTDGGKSSNSGTQVIGTGGSGGTGMGTETDVSTPNLTVAKSAEKVDLENMEITWKILFNVPSSGLMSAVVTDTAPNRWIDGATAIDFIEEGSIVVDGLNAGESYSIDYVYPQTAWDVTNKAVITFYQNQAKTQTGLQGGKDRTITVTLKTQIDEKWLNLYERSGNTYDQRHTNNVSYAADGASVSATANAQVIKGSASKTVTQVGTRTVNGVELPIYRYMLVLSNVTSDYNVIEDEYDTSLLEPYEGDVPGDSMNWFAWRLTNYNTNNRPSDTIPYVFTDKGIRFVTTPESVAHDSSSSSGFYAQYKLFYYLTVKDEAAMQAIMARAAASEDGTYKISNTATWEGNTDSADVTYEYAGLKKEILTSDDELKKTDEDIWAEFRITLNPGGQMLNGGEPLTMTDTFTNLSLDYTSIKATPSEGVSWDVSGNTATYTLPDQTPVVITYKARVVYTSIGDDGDTVKVAFSNVAEMNGYKGEVNKTAERHNSGEGAASVPVIKLLKYRAGDMTQTLAGATFALLDGDHQPVLDKNGDPVKFTSDESGLITVRGDQEKLGWTLEANSTDPATGEVTVHQYYLHEEVAPEGYMLADFDYSFQITEDGTTDYEHYVYHTGDTMSAKNYPGTDVQVAKEWSDGNANHAGDAVTVTLLQKIGDGDWSGTIRQEAKVDGRWTWVDEPSKTIELSAANNWEGAFNALPLEVPATLGDSNADDVPVEYRVVETAVNGEEPAGDSVSIVKGENGLYSFTITNTVDEKLSVPVSKNWSDNGNQDGIRPDSITVRLLANDEPTGEAAVLNAGNGWAYTFEGLDSKDADGATITYTVDEDVPTGYTKSVAGSVEDGFVITNTHVPVTIGVSAKKVWNDNDDQDGIRPETVTLKLLANGRDAGKPAITLSESNKWAAGWTDLPQKSNGSDITYAIEEVGTQSGYTVAYSTDPTDGALVATNTHAPETTSVSVEKAWFDNNNQDGLRTGEVTVNLMANGAKVDSAVLSSGNSWKHTFEDLAKKSGGKDINYTVEEASVPSGYTVAISGTAEKGYTITNTHTPEKTGITVTKAWEDSDNRDGARPASIQVQLKANGADSGSPVELNAGNNWTHTWTGLDMKAGGAAIAYTVDEVSTPAGYTKTGVSGDMQNGFVITNKHENEETSVTVNKEWADANNQDGLQKPVAVVLKADGVAQGEAVELNAGNGWTHTWTMLAKNKAGEVGQPVVYTVEEVNVPAGYEASVSENKNDDGTFSYTITNAHTPQTTSITGTKDWQDANDQDGKRATAVVLQLNKNGEAYGDPVTVTEADSWQHTWDGLPVYENGSLIAYTVTETGTDPDYSVAPGTKDNGYTVTNAYQPGKTTVTVSKVWNDQSDFDGLQPASIQVQLKANGSASGEPVTLDADNDWAYTWTNLDKMSGGKVVDYTIEEFAVSGYDVEVTGGRDATSGAFNYTVTNTHTPELTNVSVEKVWQDAENQDGLRVPVVVTLVRSDGATQTQTLNDANEWKHEWTDLPTIVDGNAVTYSVSEATAIDGYETSMTETDGAYTITNTHVPEKTSAKVTKTWNDGDDQDGKRAATVQLMANTGSDSESPWVAVDEPVAVGTDDGWTHEWNDLDKYKDGNLVTYKVVETSAPEGYSANVTRTSDAAFEYAIENSYTPEETSVTVTKAWVDADDHDGLQPESIQVQLYADNEPSGDPVTLYAGNGWTYTWTGLDKKAVGADIAYTVAETKVPGGYAMTKAGGKLENGTFDYTITNTHTPTYTTASVTKVWEDANDQDGLREPVEVQLYANGEPYGDAVTLSGTTWSHTWAQLPTVIGGNDVTYTIGEVSAPEGYAKTQSSAKAEDGSYAFTITNAHTPDVVSVPVTKVWSDEGDFDGIQPESVTVKLFADGVDTGKTVELSASNGWSGSFANLAKNAGGTPIDYTVEEVVPNGYAVAVTGTMEGGYTLTNTHVVEKTQVSVTKEWDDNDDQDGMQADGVSVQLYANGVASGAPVTLDAAHNWTHTWTGLKKNEGDAAIVYTVDEVDVATGETTVTAGYEKATTGGLVDGGDGAYAYTIINTHTPEKTSITGTKAWDDSDNQAGKRATSVQLQLNANDEPVGDPVTVTETDSWQHTWDGLDVYSGGVPIAYTVTEVGTNATADYSVAPGNAGNDYTVTNSYTPGKTSVSVTKTWVDGNNQDGLRVPVQVQLYADGEESGAPVTLSDEAGLTYTWTDLPIYKENEVGQVIQYTVDEVSVPAGYTKSVGGNAADGFTITNTHTPATTEMLVAKAWDDNDDQDGLRPQSISVTLLANGVEKATVQLNEGNKWTYRWTGLPAYQNGQKVAYSLEEISGVAGYERETIELTSTKYALKNTHAPETTDVSVTKAWDDNDDQDGLRVPIQVQLRADGEAYGAPVTLSDESGLTYTWEGLPVYKAGEVGQAIAYTVEEVDADTGEAAVPAGYSRVITGSAADGYTITNTHTPATTEKTAVKVWDDSQNQDGARPASVTVQLHDNDGAVGEPVALSSANGWSYAWENLPVMRAGTTLAYSVSEVTPAGYTSGVADNGAGTFTVTNSYTPDTTTASVTKVWDDGDNRDLTRPTSIEVQLKADGDVRETVTLDAGNQWHKEWTGLPVYKEGEVGQAVTYTVEEVTALPKYTSTTTHDGNAYTITNVYSPETVTVNAEKAWDDDSNRELLRPASATLQLKANGKVVRTLELNEENGWSTSVSGLPKNEAGEAIEYTLDEEDVPEGYSFTFGKGEGGVLVGTNKHDIRTVDIPVQKVWQDADDQDGLRPDSITVVLLADGQANGKTVVLNEGNGWKATFENLPALNGADEIQYAVQEVEVSGYASAVSGNAAVGYTITNTHAPDTTEIAGVKAWNDSDDQDGLRAGIPTVKLQLKADGAAVGEPVEVSAPDWSYTWENLPVNKSGEVGQAIVYTVDEVGVPAGYEKSVSNALVDGVRTFTVTNTHTPELVDIPVTKVWADDNDRDDLRPNSVTVNLVNGETVVGTVALNEGNDWAYTFEDLPKYANGIEIAYTVEEVAVEGYTATITGSVKDGFTVTNAHAFTPTSKTVRKVWDDSSNQDGVRPSSVWVQLHDNGGTYGAPVELSASNSWTYTWENLPVNFANGVAATYSVSEAAVEGYTPHEAVIAEDGAFEITNSYTPGVTTVSVVKDWQDANDQDGLRPESIQVQLKADGEDYGEAVTLSADNQWHYEWTGLAEKANGAAITYTVEEISVDDYESAITKAEGTFAYTVTNAHMPATTEITGTKAWSDNDDQDGLRSKVTSVKLQLKADGAAVGEPVEVSAPGWSHTWTGLDVNRDGGTPVVYTVEEVDTPAGYSANVGDADNGYTVTNAHTPETVSIPVEKRWSDADNQDGLRVPVTVVLKADGVEKESFELSASNGWKHTFTGLAKYRDGGTPIAYTVEEEAPAGYSAEVVGSSDEGFVVTNTHTPEKTSVSVAKAWDDNENQDDVRPGSVTVQLKADDAVAGEAVTLSDDNRWGYTWTGLDKYRNGGTAITYTVVEVDSGGYAPVISENESSDGTFAYTITNAHTPATTEITGTKAWSDNDDQDGLRSKVTSVKLQLKADGAAVGEPVEVSAPGWSHTWTGLDVNRDGGTPIVYTVEEVDTPAGYSANVGDADNGYTVTNAHTPAETSATVTKVWDDADDQDGKRSDSVTVQLMSSNGAYGNPVTLHAGNSWSYTWQHLPVYQNGKEVSYTVVETDVPDDYTAEVAGSVAEGFKVTNSYTPDVRNVSVVKDWQDADDQDGARPESIRVQLKADGANEGEPVTLNEENHWSYTWENLAKNRGAGTEIVYTVDEVAVPDGYAKTVAGNAADGFTIANAYTPETISIPVTKIWEDANDQDGVRPEGALLTLYADGEAVASHSAVAGERWGYTFENLPKYRNGGMPVEYTVLESAVDANYTATVEGYEVTNTHAPETIDISGTKSWVDADDAAGKRPQSITVYLLADGERVGETTATAATDWQYSFTDMPKYCDGGTEIEYSVVEKEVEGYTSAVSGYDITNTQNAVVEFVANKTLDGRTLNAGEFTFELLQGGEVIQTAQNAGDGHARFDPIEYTAADAGEHRFTIREVKGDLKGVTYDSREYDVTATVVKGEDGSLSVKYSGYDPVEGAVFNNKYVPEGVVVLEATKMVDGHVPESGAYMFQVAEANGPAVTTATNDRSGKVVFPALTFHSRGTYTYTISEVVPDGAQTLGTSIVADGVAYDTHKVGVTIEATDNLDGTLSFDVSYDGDGAQFENASVPEATFPLSAAKLITGRDFKAGDEFTFTVASSDGAPMPERSSVTIAPTNGNEAAVDFGTITFTTADLGKTYRYTVSEEGAGQTDAGLKNDPFAHYVELTVNDAGDGTMRVDASYEPGEGDLVFTNEYTASGQAVIQATKAIEGRALNEGEFFFELAGADAASAAKLPGGVDKLHASNAADGSITFMPIQLTQDDIGKDYVFTISEVAGTLGGVTYDESSYDVTVSVADNGDGTLAVTYDYGDAATAPTFRNAYVAESTSAQVVAHKMLVGGTLEGGEFDFTLVGASDNAAGVSQVAQNAADGSVTFEPIEYDAAGVYEYHVAEVVPAGATDNGDGTFTGSDGIVYDGAEHAVTVTVTDNGSGKLVADVAYDGGAAAGVSFGNTALVRTGFEFNKYFFGGVGTFDFTLTAVQADGSPRAGTPADYSDAAMIVDDGASAFTATVQNGAFEGSLAKVVFPEIAYSADGDYYYLVDESESDAPGMVVDEAQYLIHVTVEGGEVAGTTYDLLFDGVNYGPTDDLSFYNNAGVTLGFDSLSAQSYSEQAQRVSVYPKAQKLLNGSTDQLVGGDFAFELIDGLTGETIAMASNDESGNIAFFDENADPGLAYDEPGEWRYYIREVAGDEAGMTYDDSVIMLTVSVEQTDDGLAATTTYNGPAGADPVFYNVKEGMDITVQKVSRYGGEGLVDCTYALWMVGPNGDALVKEATSDENGYITFTDVTLLSGQKYYFKEVEAPKGHTVDPYRTAYFTLNEAGDALVLVEETAEDGWHSATENIEVDKANGVVNYEID